MSVTDLEADGSAGARADAATASAGRPRRQRALDQTQAERRQAAQWLAAAAAPAKTRIRLAGLCGVMAGVLVIVQSFLLALIVHRAFIDAAPVSALAGLAGLALAAVLARAGLAYGQEVWGVRAANTVQSHVRDHVLAEIIRRGPAYTRQNDAGALAATALDNVQALEGYVARYRPQMLIVMIVPILMIAVVTPVNWVAGLILTIAGPLIPVFMALIGKGAAKESARQFDVLARMGGYFLDRLRGLTTLKLFGRAEAERSAIAAVAQDFRRRTMRVLRIAFLTSAVLELFSIAAIAAVAIYVGLGLMGQITFGPAESMTLFSGLFVLLLAPEFFQPLRQLGGFYHDRASALGAAKALMAYGLPQGDHDPETARAGHGPSPATAPEIRFDRVSLAFDGRQALTSVSMRIASGETVALVGTSGAGKTSVINLILGFAEPTSGRIEIDGAPADKASLNARSAWIGQRTHLFHGTIRDNIRLGQPDAPDDAVEEAARAATVTAFTSSLPQGLDTMIGERGFGLSGGQAQRVAIARAFLKDAPLLLLDEPTANLDAQSERLVLEALDRLRRGRTVLLCTHTRTAAALADRSLRITDGRLGQDGEASS